MSNLEDAPNTETIARPWGEKAWRRAGLLLGKYWWLVLIGILLVTAALFWGLTRTEFATGQDSYLNTDSQAAIDNVAFQEEFGGETMVLLFQVEEGSDADIADLFSAANSEALQQMEADLRELGEETGEIYSVISPYTSVLFSHNILSEGVGTNALLSAGSRDTDEESATLRQEDIAQTLARLSEVEGADRDMSNPEWIDLLLFDNTGYDGIEPPGDDAERSIRLSLQSTFPDQQTAVGGVVFKGNASLDQLSEGTDRALEVVTAVELDDFSIIATGAPLYLKDINDYLQGGMLTLGAIALVIMAAILLVAFRVRWRLVPLLAVLVAVLWTFAILGYVQIDLSLVTISGLPILIGLGIDFAIQIQNRVEEETGLEHSRHPMMETLSNLGPPLLVATIAAVLAFMALQISQVPMIRDFGVMLAVGIVLILITGIIVPSAILGIREYRAPTREAKDDPLIERIIVGLGSIPQKAVVPVMVAAVALLLLGISMESDFKIESDPIRWIDQDTQTVRDIDELTEATGFASTLGILVEANNVNDEGVAEVLWGFVVDSEAREEVVSTSSTVSTMHKIINIPVDGVNPVIPTPDDLEGAMEVMPPDIRRALVAEDVTAAQVNMRLAPAGLDERSVLIDELEADLQRRIDNLDLPPDSILLVDLAPEEDPIRAIPAGLAVVGAGLLDNLTSNRAILTYVGLAVVGLWLIIRFRSLVRALLTMLPVLLAVGASAVIIGVFDLTLSPLTTVSGPLIIATCTEFSVLITSRYLEERSRGLAGLEASRRASARTGRAFFTSALTTIGGFAVLIFSAMPLLRDFGIIVTMNVAVALLSALVLMPPLLVWADTRKYLGVVPVDSPNSVVLADKPKTGSALITVIGAVAALGLVIGLLSNAETSGGETVETDYVAVALPTPEPTPEPTPTPEVEEEPAGIDVSQFGTEKPETLIGGILYDLLVGAGATDQQAVCTAETLYSQFEEAELLASGLAEFGDEAIQPVIESAEACGIEASIVDAAIATARGS
jgi:hydrophobe/amphiphile efflux-3 (HAE3) family protein